MYITFESLTLINSRTNAFLHGSTDSDDIANFNNSSGLNIMVIDPKKEKTDQEIELCQAIHCQIFLRNSVVWVERSISIIGALSSDLLAFTDANATQIKCIIPSTIVYIFALMYIGRINKQHRTLCTHEFVNEF